MSEILLIPLKTVSEIVLKGFIEPDVQRGAGRGKQNRFSGENLVEIRLFWFLTKFCGTTRAYAADAIRGFRKTLPKKAFDLEGNGSSGKSRINGSPAMDAWAKKGPYFETAR